MSRTDPTEVLVIGSGPVGLTLAGELQRHGVRVRLIERKTGPNTHPNAAVVHVRTQEILCAMGAVEGFLREGYPLSQMHAHALGKPVATIEIGHTDSPFGGPRTLGQQHTERLLAEHFEKLGGRIERGVEAVKIEQDQREARVTLRHLTEANREEIVRASWVIGCEGSASVTREAAGMAFEGKRYEGKEFLQVEANLRWNLPHGSAYMFLTPEHILLFFPYDDLGFYRIICARDDENPEHREPPTLEEIQDIVRKVVDPAAELYDPRWFNRFRSGHRIAARFREGRLFLAGDAGHVHVPIGGQGMNYGMHDAFNLGWKLAAVIKGDAAAALLDTYEEERRPVDQALVRWTDRAFHILIGHPLATGRALRIFGPPVLRLPAIQKRIRRGLGELMVSYPASNLNEDHGGSGGPPAGARAPDAQVVRMPEQKTAHVFDLLRGTRWTLLLFAGTSPENYELEKLARLSADVTQLAAFLILTREPPVPLREHGSVPTVMDRELRAHQAYGVSAAPCLYLIRPDWYVGFRGSLEHEKELSRYLAQILP